jgi:release factor glutamine methyltransferase
MIVHGRDAVPEAMEHKVEAWMARRRTGEPWAYILGWAEFRGHRIGVTPSVLIPRPETELVLEAALETGRRLGVEHVCDIGTGSGILAIFMALETNWRVQASDLSPAALAVAKVNAQRLKAEITFHEGDLLSPIPDPLGLVVSNPPYVDPADEPGLQRELGFEPRMALFAPEAGLALSTQLLAQAWERRAWGCVLEIGAGQGAELCRRALELGWPQAECRSDWAGHDRILIVTR